MAGLNKYQAYPEYRDSGMEWCNELPLNWKKTKLRWLSNIFAGGTPSKNVIDYWENGTVPWISSGAVNQGYIVEPSTYISNAALENSSAKWIPKGALVVALAGQGKTKGMVAQLGINTTCNQSMAAIVLYKKNQSRYIFWWLISNYQNIRNMAGGDLRDGLNLELLGDIQCPKPRNDESSKIALFLDHETAKIDDLIEKQQQLIELLKEKRQAVISHAVTKGLNPDVPMKDSGLTGLGEAPSHWFKSKLANTGDETKGCFVNGPFGSDLLASELKEEGVPVVYIRDIKATGYNRKSTVYVTHQKAQQLEICKLSSNDVIFSKVGDPPGEACVYPKNEPDAVITQDVMRVRVNKKTFNAHFIAYLLNTNFGRQTINNISIEGTRKRVSLGDFKTTKFIFPPLGEAQSIVNALNEKCAQIDLIIFKTNQAIMLIQERRTALISAAVTGKIDLRNWTAPIPEAETPTEVSA